MVTREEVANKCGVSTMTVTRVISGKGYVKEETREKVQKVIEELNYIPNKQASNLAHRKSNEIAVILPDLMNPYYLQIINSIIKEATKYGYIVTIFKANENELPKVLQEIISIRVAGVINYSTAFPKKYIKALATMQVKTIRQDGFANEVGIKLDYSDAIDQAMDVLKLKGAKNILFISGMDKKYTKIDPRPSLFLSSMKSHGFETDENSIILGNYPEDDAFSVGYNLALKILQGNEKPDAVFCMNDMMAFGVINAAKKCGMVLPNSLAVIGFDNIYLSAYYDPSLSTISLDIENEAKMYFEFIADVKIDRKSYVNAHFIERDSTNFVSKN